MLKELVVYIVKHLVYSPEAVQVQEIEQDQKKVLKIIVDQQDTGKVIGKDGQSIKAIRALVALFKTADEPFEDVVIDS